MTRNERRLTFAYSKLCDIDIMMNFCKNLICGSAYDKDLVKDQKVRDIWYKLTDIEKQILKLRFEIKMSELKRWLMDIGTHWTYNDIHEDIENGKLVAVQGFAYGGIPRAFFLKMM